LYDPLLVDVLRRPKALQRVDLPSFDMKRGEHGVRRTPGRLEAVPRLVDDHAFDSIAAADSPYHADVMYEQRARIMQPIFRWHRLGKEATTDDLLANERNHQGMLYIMVKRA
jgi:hypothetical protein